MNPEIKLIELKDKIKKSQEKADSQHEYLVGVIFGSLTFFLLAGFIYWKKIFDEYWIYAFWASIGLAIIGLVLIPFAYKWMKEAEKKTKELKKQEKELKEAVI